MDRQRDGGLLLADGRRLDLRVHRLAYRSKINFFLYESAEFNDDKLLEGGLRVGYRAPDSMWEVAAFGRNITNDRSLEGGIDFNNLTGFVNDPRTLGVEVKAKF